MTVAVGPIVMSDKVALIVAVGGVLLLIGGIWYVKYKAGQVVDAVTPWNNQNVINTTTNAVLAPALGTNKLTGKTNTIGSATYFAVDNTKKWLSGLL